jgi:hypothetical protein
MRTRRWIARPYPNVLNTTLLPTITSHMPSREFVVPSFRALFLLALAACTPTPDPVPQLSDQCVTCLTKTTDGGCQQQWDACNQVSECGDYAVCQMQAMCYARAPDDGCERDLGCPLPDGATSGGEPPPSQLSADFEHCARTTCRKICGFVAP